MMRTSDPAGGALFYLETPTTVTVPWHEVSRILNTPTDAASFAGDDAASRAVCTALWRATGYRELNPDARCTGAWTDDVGVVYEKWQAPPRRRR